MFEMVISLFSVFKIFVNPQEAFVICFWSQYEKRNFGVGVENVHSLLYSIDIVSYLFPVDGNDPVTSIQRFWVLGFQFRTTKITT